MTTLYRPVPITSAAQAEALPEGAFLRRPTIDESDGGAVALVSNRTVRAVDDYGPSLVLATELVSGGWEILVPIEAEEEMDTDYYMGGDGSPMRRYVTPWESV